MVWEGGGAKLKCSGLGRALSVMITPEFRHPPRVASEKGKQIGRVK